VTLTAAHQAAGGLSHRDQAWQAAVLACGAALFLTGNVIVRRQLGTGPVRQRAVAAAVALATIPAGLAAGLEAQLAVVAVVLVAPLVAEREPAGKKGAGAGTAG
jgi:hypothetical protein